MLKESRQQKTVAAVVTLELQGPSLDPAQGDHSWALKPPLPGKAIGILLATDAGLNEVGSLLLLPSPEGYLWRESSAQGELGVDRSP